MPGPGGQEDGGKGAGGLHERIAVCVGDCLMRSVGLSSAQHEALRLKRVGGLRGFALRMPKLTAKSGGPSPFIISRELVLSGGFRGMGKRELLTVTGNGDGSVLFAPYATWLHRAVSGVSRSSQSLAIKNVLDVLRQKCRKAKANAKKQRRAEGQDVSEGASEPEGQDVPEGAPAVKVSRGRQALGLGSGSALRKSLQPKETKRLKVGLASSKRKGPLDWRKIKLIDDDEVLAATTRSGLRVPLIFNGDQ
jgi:hypothetical protein